MDDLIKYRMSSAKEKVTSAKLLLEAGMYRDSIYIRATEMLAVIEEYIGQSRN